MAPNRASAMPVGTAGKARRDWRCRGSAALLAAACAPPGFAFEALEWGALRLEPSFNTRLGLQHGDNVNYGLGALDSLGETERSV
ncbi:MAG: hypothetical protein RLW42_24745, partial [Gammaproteobacteria bacterium]